MGGRRQYDEATKQTAIRLAARVGESNAAAELGLPVGTVNYWMSLYKKAHASMSPSRDLMGGTLIDGRPVVERATDGVAWEDRARTAADESGALVVEAIATARAYMAQGRTADALNAYKVAASAIEKAQLLVGGATTREESRSLSLNGSLSELSEILSGKTRNTTKNITSGLVIPAETVADQPKDDDAH